MSPFSNTPRKQYSKVRTRDHPVVFLGVHSRARDVSRVLGGGNKNLFAKNAMDLLVRPGNGCSRCGGRLSEWRGPPARKPAFCLELGEFRDNDDTKTGYSD